MKMVQPLTDKIFVKKVLLEDEPSASGLIVIDSSIPKQEIAIVLSIGPGERNKVISVGDSLILAKYNGVELYDDHFIIHIDSVHGILDK